MPMPVDPDEKPLFQYWRESLRDILGNARYALGILVVLAVWLVVSSVLLQIAEGREHYWQALYNTWTTMTTMGPLDGPPHSVVGKILISVDALAGLILLGSVVWLVTTSLSRR
jgi:hypothetical protein